MRQLTVANVRDGSISTEIRCPRYVRFPPIATKSRTCRHFGFGPIAAIVADETARSSAGALGARHASSTSSIELMLLLCAAYVFGCAFRSFLPRADVQRICLFDTWLSSVVVGRSVATVAEICFAAQWAIILYQLGTIIRRHRQFPTKREADAFHAKARTEVAAGAHTPDSASITVAEAAELWIARCERDGLERMTILAYRQHVDLHNRTPHRQGEVVVFVCSRSERLP